MKMKIEDMLAAIDKKMDQFGAEMCEKSIKYLDRMIEKLTAEKAKVQTRLNKLKGTTEPEKVVAPPVPVASTATKVHKNQLYTHYSKVGYKDGDRHNLVLERIEEVGPHLNFYFFDPVTGQRIWSWRMAKQPTTEAAVNVWKFDLKWIAKIDAMHYSAAKVISTHRALYNKDYNRDVKVVFKQAKGTSNVMFVAR